jgi:hypothetical protein
MQNPGLFKSATFCLSAVLLITACSNEIKKDAVTENKRVEEIAGDTTIPASAVKSDDYEANSSDEQLRQFIPSGYSLLDSASGNLNLDAFTDLVIILKKDGEDSSSDVTEHPEKRPLLLLTGTPDGSYQLEGRNDNTVYCIDCGGVMGDPYMDVVIKNGFFSVEHYGGSSWRWTRIVTYKYSPAEKRWYLFKDGHESFHSSDPEKVERKVLTSKDFGRIVFQDFDIYKEE